jgi:hypothetical protein
MGMAKYLSVSKLLACFRSCSFTSDFEVKAVCDESGFCSSVACVAIVSRMGTGGKDGEVRTKVEGRSCELDSNLNCCRPPEN